MTANQVRIPADPEKPIRTCDKGKHAPPRSVGGGGGYDWDVTDAEFNFWHFLDQPAKDQVLREASGECFLCVLDRLMTSHAGIV